MLVQLVRTLATGDLEEFARQAELVAQTTPAPGAASIWALCVATGIFLLDLMGCARRAEHLLQAFTAGHQLVGAAEPGATVYFHAVFSARMAYAEEDPLQGLVHSEAKARTSRMMGQRRYVEIAKIFIGIHRWYLGILPGTDRMLMDVTLPDSDIGAASAYRPFVLGWLLADRGSFDEARRAADGLIEAGRARRLPVDEGRGHWIRAEVLRRAGELDGAGAAIEAGLTLLRVAAPLDVPGALATLAAIRRAQGRLAEALAAAGEALALYETSTTCGFFRGAFVRLVHAECLEAAGEHAAAKVAIGKARERLLGNAAKIGDLEYRRSFLEEVPENRRTLELALAWVGPIEQST
jgi:tetratricopeptide (TPR) repeat protein